MQLYCNSICNSIVTLYVTLFLYATAGDSVIHEEQVNILSTENISLHFVYSFIHFYENYSTLIAKRFER